MLSNTVNICKWWFLHFIHNVVVYPLLFPAQIFDSLVPFIGKPIARFIFFVHNNTVPAEDS